MKTKQTLVPELRFYNDKGNPYPDWEEKKLGKVARFLKGKGISKAEVAENGATPCVRYGELYTHYNELITVTKSFTNIDNDDLELSQGNDVIIPASGETHIDIATASCVKEKGIALGGDLNIIRSEQNGVFMAYYMNGSLRINIARLAQGSSVIHLYATQLKDLNMHLPPLPEQEKIAAFLTSVDDRIDQLKRKKSLLQDYKKGVMQKLFSQELRFKDDNGKPYPDWEEKKLGEVGETYGGLSGKSGDDFGEGMPFVTYSQIFGSSVVDMEKCKLVRIEENERQNQIKKGDILFTTSSETRLEVGFTSVVLDEPNEVYLNSFCFGFRLNNFDTLLTEFARYLFHSSEVRRSIAVLGQGSTRYNISKKELMKQQLLLPSVSEQTKIANFLSTLDQKIEQIDTQITQTQSFKKGLLQQMFV